MTGQIDQQRLGFARDEIGHGLTIEGEAQTAEGLQGQSRWR